MTFHDMIVLRACGVGGIGKATAIGVAKLQATVVVGRDPRAERQDGTDRRGRPRR